MSSAALFTYREKWCNTYLLDLFQHIRIFCALVGTENVRYAKFRSFWTTSRSIDMSLFFCTFVAYYEYTIPCIWAMYGCWEMCFDVHLNHLSLNLAIIFRRDYVNICCKIDHFPTPWSKFVDKIKVTYWIFVNGWRHIFQSLPPSLGGQDSVFVLQINIDKRKWIWFHISEFDFFFLNLLAVLCKHSYIR